MDREKAIQILTRCEAEAYCSHYKQHFCCIGCGQREALDLAIEALEREIEYGQVVVDFTKGETMKSDEWKYDTTCDAESATTTDCISREQAIGAWDKLSKRGRTEFDQVLMTLPPVTPPKRVVAEIKVDTEELVKRIKEECQVERTGKWIRQRIISSGRETDMVVCSECREEYSYDAETGVSMDDYRVCPNCGAKMGGDTE